MIALTYIDPSWGLSVVLVLGALAGIGITVVHVLPWSMIPDAIQELTGPIPAFFFICGIGFAILFPLNRDRHSQVRALIDSRRVKD